MSADFLVGDPRSKSDLEWSVIPDGERFTVIGKSLNLDGYDPGDGSLDVKVWYHVRTEHGAKSTQITVALGVMVTWMAVSQKLSSDTPDISFAIVTLKVRARRSKRRRLGVWCPASILQI